MLEDLEFSLEIPLGIRLSKDARVSGVVSRAQAEILGVSKGSIVKAVKFKEVVR